MVKKILRSYDYSLLFVYLILSVFGLVMVYSSSMVIAVQIYGEESDYFFHKQTVNFLLSFFVFLLFAAVPYKLYKSNKFLVPMVLLSLFALLSLFFFGNVVNNAQSWFMLGTRSIQPSEFVKLAVIIYLAAVYAKKQAYIHDFNKAVAPPLVFLILSCFLTAVQPDIGTAIIIFFTGAVIIFCSGMGWKNIFRLVMIFAVLAVVFSPIILAKRDVIFSEERLGRIYGYLDPFAYEQGEGHQLVNSYLAIGSGGWKGLGLGRSIQKLGYLPEAHTDFIMAIIAEELGVFGVLFVIGSLAYIVLRGIFIGLRCRDPFGSLLAFGISGMIGIQ
ncbi:FtsW/RodA/SpoVE family cell cycle protein, partial [Caldibacillus debilis]